MSTKFEMSMFGKIKKFIGLQVCQTPKGIYVTQSKYVKEMFRMDESMVIGVKLSNEYTASEVDQIQ